MFAAFYRDYVAAGAALGVAPLRAVELAALPATLLERPTATLHWGAL